MVLLDGSQNIRDGKRTMIFLGIPCLVGMISMHPTFVAMGVAVLSNSLLLSHAPLSIFIIVFIFLTVGFASPFMALSSVSK